MPILDRRVPTDWRHVERHRLMRLLAPHVSVEKVLNIPRQYSNSYDQGQQGKCVAFSQSWMMSILNRKLYDPNPLYDEAQRMDEWDDTPPMEGTSVRAGFDVLRTVGHWRFYKKLTRKVELDEGIEANKWATTVDEVRECISNNLPVNFGINWYSNFSNPIRKAREDDSHPASNMPPLRRTDYWIGQGQNWGSIEGGHAITCVAASDQRQAFAFCNTWGNSYPFLVWMPYASVQRLLNEDGEAGVVQDRP